MDRFIKLENIGIGTYAQVFKGKCQNTNEYVALKEITLNPEEGAPSTALREISILKELQHPNIIKLLNVVHTEITLTLVFEYMEYDLKQFLKLNAGRITGKVVMSIMRQILLAIKCCHENEIIHRDIKPQNILLNSTGKVKIADFGLARSTTIPVKSYSSQVITLWYRPPEVLLGAENYDYKVDIWSIGCVFIELVTGTPAFPGNEKSDQLEKILNVVGFPSNDCMQYFSGLSESHLIKQFDSTLKNRLAYFVPSMDFIAFDLLSKLVEPNPQNRIGASQALDHKYFQ